jgi:hypothetical protein
MSPCAMRTGCRTAYRSSPRRSDRPRGAEAGGLRSLTVEDVGHGQLSLRRLPAG